MLASLLGVIPWDVNINSGEDFYKVFVAEPSTATASAAVSTSAPTTVATTPAAAANTPQAQPKNWAQAKPNVLAYPSNPAVVQADLGNGNSYLTGYFFPEQSLAVLSVPSFQMTGIGAQSFSATVNTFITQAKANGLQRIILDVQSNGGGDKLLSTELFKNVSPRTSPKSHYRTDLFSSSQPSTLSLVAACGLMTPPTFWGLTTPLPSSTHQFRTRSSRYL